MYILMVIVFLSLQPNGELLRIKVEQQFKTMEQCEARLLIMKDNSRTKYTFKRCFNAEVI